MIKKTYYCKEKDCREIVKRKDKYCKRHLKGHKLNCKCPKCNPGKYHGKGTIKGWKHTIKTKKVISENSLRQWNRPGFREKMIRIHKDKWKRKEYREKQIKAILRGSNIRPTKPELKLKKMLNPNEYKYVGDGSLIIGGFNPDFVNINGKKILIEVFGRYWHNLDINKERDKQRLKTYKKYGYKTLIIWDDELDNNKELKKLGII